MPAFAGSQFVDSRLTIQSSDKSEQLSPHKFVAIFKKSAAFSGVVMLLCRFKISQSITAG